MKRIKLKRFDGMVKDYPEALAKILVKSKRFKYCRKPKNQQEPKESNNNQQKTNKK